MSDEEIPHETNAEPAVIALITGSPEWPLRNAVLEHAQNLRRKHGSSLTIMTVEPGGAPDKILREVGGKLGMGVLAVPYSEAIRAIVNESPLIEAAAFLTDEHAAPAVVAYTLRSMRPDVPLNVFRHEAPESLY